MKNVEREKKGYGRTLAGNCKEKGKNMQMAG
jgi:hypothetical protein